MREWLDEVGDNPVDPDHPATHILRSNIYGGPDRFTSLLSFMPTDKTLAELEAADYHVVAMIQTITGWWETYIVRGQDRLNVYTGGVAGVGAA